MVSDHATIKQCKHDAGIYAADYGDKIPPIAPIQVPLTFRRRMDEPFNRKSYSAKAANTENHWQSKIDIKDRNFPVLLCQKSQWYLNCLIRQREKKST